MGTQLCTTRAGASRHNGAPVRPGTTGPGTAGHEGALGTAEHDGAPGAVHPGPALAGALRRLRERRYRGAEASLRAALSLLVASSRLIQPSITSSLTQEVISA
jgi:hypothetical protein